MIKTVGLYKSFKSIKAVQNLSLDIPDGKISGLLGPNGSGKSTTMRMITGLLAADAGAVTVDGYDAIEETQAVKRCLGVVPDSRGLYTRLTAAENIAYFGRLHGLSKTVLEQRISQLAEQLDMTDLLARRCEGFSQGQRVKVAIARAMIGDPQNLLLDEPGNGLDVMSNRALRDFLRHQRQAGKAILLSTHLMHEVAALCDHIIIIADGEVRAQGDTEQLKRQANEDNLEDAFVKLIGTEEGLMA